MKAEELQGRPDLDKSAKDKNKENDDFAKNIGLSQTKIDYFKQIPKKQLIQTGFGDLNLDDESVECKCLSHRKVRMTVAIRVCFRMTMLMS